jgi:Uma2 family endonuclease
VGERAEGVKRLNEPGDSIPRFLTEGDRMSTVGKKLLTAEEYFLLPDPNDGTIQELVRGEIVAMPQPGLEHGEVQLNVGSLIKQFPRANPVGRVVTESGVITERGPDTVRGPDVSYYSKERLPLGKRVVGYTDEPPDLCIEVVSPSNSVEQLKAKAKEFLFAGVRAVWIIDPAKQTVRIITDPLEYRTLEAGAILDGGEVLPGFSCKVADLFG